jgi:tetratricopeptide (TPR) repeat protein
MSILRDLSRAYDRFEMRLFPVIVVLFLIGAAAHASEPIKVYGGKAHDWAIKFSNDAEAQLRKGDLDGASHSIAEALRYDPSYWPALYVRAKISGRRGKWDEMIRDCTELLRQDSTFAPAALLRAQANIALRNYAAARKELDHVVEIQPREQFYAMAFNQRAWFRATCPDPSLRNAHGAVEDAKKACSITQWREADPIDTLAVASAEAGDFDSAVRYLERAMKAYDAGEMQKTLEQHLAMFKQHRPITAR